jgi:hypothetical protein
MCIGPYAMYRLLCQVVMKLEFSRQIFEKSSNVKFMEIRPEGAELLVRTDGRTDMATLKVNFRNFAKSPKSPVS